MSSLQQSIENSEELLEQYKDVWDLKTLEQQLRLQSIAKYNKSLWDEENEKEDSEEEVNDRPKSSV